MMTRTQTRMRAERGAALVFSILALGVLMVFGFGITSLGMVALKTSGNERETNEVLAIPDAGVSHAKRLVLWQEWGRFNQFLQRGDAAGCNGDELAVDISQSASFSNPSSGLYYARHQLDVAGSPVINGQLVALNEADTPYPATSNQTNNPVQLTGGRMELTGSPTINYAGNGLFAARMVSWRECRDLAPGDPNGPCAAPDRPSTASAITSASTSVYERARRH